MLEFSSKAIYTRRSSVLIDPKFKIIKVDLCFKVGYPNINVKEKIKK